MGWLKAGAGVVAALVLISVGVLIWAPNADQDGSPNGDQQASVSNAHPSLLYGRVTVGNGSTYEGRVRWGRDQEAFWGDYFNGYKRDNPWAAYVPPEQRRRESRSVTVFGVDIASWQAEVDLGRPFMIRFGDIARLARTGRLVRVTLKSGATVELDFNSYNDLDDGVRVWDIARGGRDLDASRIRAVDFLEAPAGAEAPRRLHGTVRPRLAAPSRDSCSGTATSAWERTRSTAARRTATSTSRSTRSGRSHAARTTARS